MRESKAIRCKPTHRDRKADMPGFPSSVMLPISQRELRRLFSHEQIAA
ncbi:hypothetical protein [Paraburkholderia sp. DGU8]